MTPGGCGRVVSASPGTEQVHQAGGEPARSLDIETGSAYRSFSATVRLMDTSQKTTRWFGFVLGDFHGFWYD
jgi:hypothetical protein